MSRVYLDHAASSPLRPEAAAAMAEVAGQPGNPSSLHGSGRAARKRLEVARESLAESLRAHPTEIVLTSGGTEANNLALLGLLAGRREAEPGRDELLISALEHPSIAHAVRRPPGPVGIIPANHDGRVSISGLSAMVNDRTALVSVMSVNNETGVIQPIEAVVAGCAGAWVHSDAVQAFGHLPVRFGESGLDALSVSAHKLGGPVGIGALVVRRDRQVIGRSFGGGQERRIRSGTATVTLAVGFATAAEAAMRDRQAEAERLGALRERLIERVLAEVPDALVNGSGACSPAIVNIGFPGCRADDALLLLDQVGLDVSTGSACTAGVHQPSDVLLAMGRSVAEASAALRFSFGWSTTADDIERLVAVLPDAVRRARQAF